MPGKIQEIIHHPHPTLRQIAKPIKESKISSESFKQMLADLEATMMKKDGAGLAAPQIGISERIVVIAGKNGKNMFLINPQITRRSWAKAISEEGCLSVIDSRGQIIYGQVERHKRVTCLYLDHTGKKKKVQADEHLSRVIQHELDHLDGILFIDRLIV